MSALAFTSSKVVAAEQSVIADHQVTFAGVPLGKFSFRSDIRDGTYQLRASSKMKLAFGAFKWNSAMVSSGRLAEQGPRPAAYNFTYKMNKKSGFTRMKFAGAKVDMVQRKPNKPSKTRIKVQPAHLQNVLDPMSAVLALSAGAQSGDPCRRKVPVFDGKQRFNLVLKPKRKERIQARGPGAPSIVHVCQVTYIPISGHKMNRQTKYMARNRDIETWMMPIPDAGLFAPYKIVLPVYLGSAVINTTRLRIQTKGKAPIALTF